MKKEYLNKKDSIEEDELIQEITPSDNNEVFKETFEEFEDSLLDLGTELVKGLTHINNKYKLTGQFKTKVNDSYNIGKNSIVENVAMYKEFSKYKTKLKEQEIKDLKNKTKAVKKAKK